MTLHMLWIKLTIAETSNYYLEINHDIVKADMCPGQKKISDLQLILAHIDLAKWLTLTSATPYPQDIVAYQVLCQQLLAHLFFIIFFKKMY